MGKGGFVETHEVVAFVQEFLRRMEARDLEAAQALMDPGARITFPGPTVFKSQAEMVEASRGRYEWIKKTFDRTEVVTAEGAAVVYIMGTLYGVNRHGVPFSDIRYIDRFEVRGGLIARQDVWNDLAESGVLEQKE